MRPRATPNSARPRSARIFAGRPPHRAGLRAWCPYQIGRRCFRIGRTGAAAGHRTGRLNINRDVGSTHPQALAELVRKGRDLGIAFDGDGDRVLFVDRGGHVVDGDALIHILARHWHAKGRLHGPVVGTLMTNFALEKDLAARGIGFVRTKVGDRYVHQALVEQGGVLGGEASGHILCLDRASTGDAIISALQVLEALHEQGLTLEQALADYQPLPQRTVNIPVSGGQPRMRSPHASAPKPNWPVVVGWCAPPALSH